MPCHAARRGTEGDSEASREGPATRSAARQGPADKPGPRGGYLEDDGHPTFASHLFPPMIPKYVLIVTLDEPVEKPRAINRRRTRAFGQPWPVRPPEMVRSPSHPCWGYDLLFEPDRPRWY